MRWERYCSKDRSSVQVFIMSLRIEGYRVAIAVTGIDETQAMSIHTHIDTLCGEHGASWVADLSIVLIVPEITPIPLNSRNVECRAMFLTHQVRSNRPLNISVTD